jgi:hypothetical protein
MTPITGKANVAKSRIIRTAGVMSRHGTQVCMVKVVAGDGAGDLHLYGSYPDLASGAKAFESFSADAEMIALMKERDLDSVAEVKGPWFGWMIHGGPPVTPKLVTVHHDYHMPRSWLSAAMELIPELDALMKQHHVDVAVGVPLLGPDHELMCVAYWFSSIEHWGKSVDAMGRNKAFVTLVEKTNFLGTLKTSRHICFVQAWVRDICFIDLI